MFLLITIFIIGFIFEYINGFHDAANSIATIVTTKALSLKMAVIWAAGFNFCAYFIFKNMTVAKTMTHLINGNSFNLEVILVGLIAAIIWNLITWYFGIPNSSSHCLIGGLIGSAVTMNGFSVLNMSNISLILIFIVLAPLIGMVISILITFLLLIKKPYVKSVVFMSIILLIFFLVKFNNTFEKWGLLSLGIIFTFILFVIYLKRFDYSKTNKTYKNMQFYSSAIMSIGHGGTDSQKMIGIFALVLINENKITDLSHLPIWVPLSCYSFIALGTLSGGTRIIKTMGTKITRVTPFEGVCSETAAAISLFTANNLGAPVSSSHTLTGAIMGVGMVRRFSSVRWSVIFTLLWAWILTIPLSAFLAYLIFQLYLLFH